MTHEVRNQQARALAEQCLGDLVRGFGEVDVPVVLLGGLVPPFLCRAGAIGHEGTTDVDIQLDLEIDATGTHGEVLEGALLGAGFEVDPHRAWRWNGTGTRRGVKIEFLCDRPDQPADGTVMLASCQRLGASNLRGTGFASRNPVCQELPTATPDGATTVSVRVASLAGYLMAKAFAVRFRRAEKDHYDFAYVLIHNDAGGPEAAIAAVRDEFGAELATLVTTLRELKAAFLRVSDQGPRHYADTSLQVEPDGDYDALAADASAAVRVFCEGLLTSEPG